MKKTGWILAIAVLLVTAIAGLAEGISDLALAAPPLQRSVTLAVSLYGILGAFGAVGLMRKRPWVVPVTVAWSIPTVYAATVASFAFHDPTFEQQGTRTGTIASFITSAVIVVLVVWAARVATKAVTTASTT
jgi:hypothetical protein